MEDRREFLNRYKQQIMEQRKTELNNSSHLIQSFIDLCKTKSISLNEDFFDYIPTIGIVAKYPNIVHLLNKNIPSDKEGLINAKALNVEFSKRPFAEGYYYSDKYMIMAHPYFRRGYYEKNNFSPRFIELFWEYGNDMTQKYIAIDENRVRINVDNSVCQELDTWYGATFSKTIAEIGNGVVKLVPPPSLSSFDIDAFFGNAISLYIKWSNNNQIKEFQLEEFKAENTTITKNGTVYHPAKYIHAEFDIEKDCFRHFDGAIHFYTEEEYYQRREQDFNYNNKNAFQIKPLSQKLFKMDGQVSIENWIELTCHYLTGDPLIHEYFEGKLPDYILDILWKQSK